MSHLEPHPVLPAVEAHCAISTALPAAALVTLARASRAVVGPSAQQALADAYDAAPAFDPAAAVRYWRPFRDETMRQWHVLESLGFTLRVSATDPYADATELRADVARRRIVVLSTRATGGHPYLSDAVNDAFRAVHDVVAHCATGRGFDRHGEEAAFRAHAALYSAAALPALVTETRAQNAYLITRGTFGAQKIAAMPARWLALDAMAPSAAELPDATADAVARHQ